jgi:hypothetical protein
MSLPVIAVIGAIIVVVGAISAYYIYNYSIQAQEEERFHIPADIPFTAQSLLAQQRPKGHYLAIMAPDTDIVTNRIFGNVTIANPTSKSFKDCQFLFISSKMLDGSPAVNGTNTIVLKKYDTVPPYFIDVVRVPSMHYYRGDKLVFECKSPADSVEFPLYLP